MRGLDGDPLLHGSAVMRVVDLCHGLKPHCVVDLVYLDQEHAQQGESPL